METHGLVSSASLCNVWDEVGSEAIDEVASQIRCFVTRADSHDLWIMSPILTKAQSAHAQRSSALPELVQDAHIC